MENYEVKEHEMVSKEIVHEKEELREMEKWNRRNGGGMYINDNDLLSPLFSVWLLTVNV